MLAHTFAALAVLAGTTLAESPVWFLYEQGSDQSFSVRVAQCEQVSPSFDDNGESYDGPIIIPSDDNIAAEICINFPPVPEKNLAGGWRHDIGSKGACANGCCEFKPPVVNAAAVNHPGWFESNDCSSIPSDVFNAPVFFQGDADDAKTVCIEEGESYVQVEGKLGNCGGKCCIFYKNE